MAKAHGIRGELLATSGSPTLFEATGYVLLGRPGEEPMRYAVRKAKAHQGRTIFALAGVTDRNAAEALRGSELLLPRTALPELDEDEIYLTDVLGARLVSPTGREYGRVVGFFEPTPGQELWVIDCAGEEVLFPAEDVFILEFREDGEIVVDPPGGLFPDEPA